VSARDQTLETLRRGIISLELAPGSPVSENELAARLGVSRTPVRESLILLQEDGLVQVFPQLGTFVSRVDAGKVAQAQFIKRPLSVPRSRTPSVQRSSRAFRFCEESSSSSASGRPQ